MTVPHVVSSIRYRVFAPPASRQRGFFLEHAMKSSDEKMFDAQPLGKALPRAVAPAAKPVKANTAGTILKGPDGRLETCLPMPGAASSPQPQIRFSTRMSHPRLPPYEPL